MEEGNGALQVVSEDQHHPEVFDTKNPAAVIERATTIANSLMPLINKAQLYSMISGKKYVRIEGWNTMLSMLGIFPQVEYCRKLERPDCAYEARVVLKTIAGQVVGAGEALCSSAERNWGNRDEFAIKSMAQTRATGKAARNGFSWIMALAGFEATPAEEMVHEERNAPQNAPQRATEPTGDNLYTSRFSAPEMFTSKKNGKGYWAAFDQEGSKFFIFSETVAALISEKADQQITVELERTEKGTRIIGVI